MLVLALAATLAFGQTGQTTPPRTGTPGAGQTGVPGRPGEETTGFKERIFSPLSRRTPRPVFGAPALYGNWRSCVIGGGGGMGGVVFTSDPNILYARGDASGLYRSDDGGRRWRMLQGGLPIERAVAVRDLSVDPKNPDRVLALVGDEYAAPQGLFESRDGGRTWNRLLTLTVHANGPYRWTGGLIARDPRESRTIVVGSAGDGVYRSVDDGRTWRQVGAGAGDPNGVLRDAYLTDLRFDRSDSRRIWAAATPTRTYDYTARGERDYAGGWFASDDGGRSWVRIDRVAPTEFVQDEARPERLVGIFDGLDVFASDDRGRTWRPYEEGLQIAKEPDREPYASDARFDALTSGPGFQLLATARGTLYRRNTNETAWQQVLPEGTTQFYEGRSWVGEDGPGRPRRFGIATSNVAIDPRDPNHLWSADAYGIYESRDGGKNLELSMDGIETGTIRAFETDPATPEIVHLGMVEFGYLTSRDGGSSFGPGRVAGGTDPASRPDGGRVNATMQSISAALWAPARLIASGDPGDDPTISNTVWLSADRGGSWTRSPMTGLPNREAHTIQTIAWDPSRMGRAYAAVGGVGGGVFVSTDGGLSWLRDSDGLSDASDLFPAEGTIVGRELALDGDGAPVVISRTRSEVYRREAGRYVLVTGIEGQPNEVAATPGSLAATPIAARGITDLRVPGTTVPGTRVPGTTVPGSTSPAGARGGIGRAQETAPNGAETSGGRPIRRVGGTFFVATDRGIYRSDDAGRTWTRTLPRPTRYVTVDRANPRRVAAGCADGVWLSEDGGLRWRETDSGLPERAFPRVGFAAGRLLAGTLGSGAFWTPLGSGGYVVAEARPLPREAVAIPTVRPGAQGTPLELLADGGFEDARRFSALWRVGYVGRGRLEIESVGGAPEAGARSLRLRAISSDSAGSAAARLVSPPRRFRVTGAARSAGATREALVGVQAFDPEGKPTGFVVLFDARNADKWRRFSADVELPAGTERANLVTTYAGSGSVSLDDVAFESIVEGVTDPARPLPTDILDNGGFEEASKVATDWTVGYQATGTLQISVTPVRPHSGERALLVRNSGSIPVEGAAAYKLLKLPRRFRFEGWARVEGTPRTATIAIQAFDFDGRQVSFSVAIDARSAREWQSFSTEIELPDEVESAYVVATLDGTGSLLLDDLRLTTLIERR